MFNAEKTKNDIVKWIQEFFKPFGETSKAVIGISGGADSSIVAALCVEALGKERVVGVLMPQGVQPDIKDSITLCKHLDIKYHIVDIGPTVDNLLCCIWKNTNIDTFSSQTTNNLPPRIRMATLYAIAQSINGFPSCNCNLSEDWVGYSTYGGDGFGSFAPLARLTKTEVKEIGKKLNLPDELVNKTPADGLCGMDDETNWGFTYKTLDKYIRTGEIKYPTTKERIDAMHKKNLFKTQPIPTFEYES